MHESILSKVAAQVVKKPADPADRASDDASFTPLRPADRSLPRWAGVLSALFTLGSSLCLLSVAVLAVFFQSLVVDQGTTLLAWLLAAVGTVPVLGALALNYAHNRALAGFRGVRTAHAYRVEAAVGALAAVILCTVHPLLGLPPLLSGALSYAGTRLLAYRSTREPIWDFNAAEAVSILSGRDRLGLDMALCVPKDHALQAGLQRSILWLSVLAALSVGSFLAATNHVAPQALGSVVLISLWSADALGRFFANRLADDPFANAQAHRVEEAVLPPAEEEADVQGLRVTGLSVDEPGGANLLSDINFSLPPGTTLGIIGPTGAGKSLLLQSIIAPLDATGLAVRGTATLHGQSLWKREIEGRSVPAVLLPPEPLLLNASGLQNLSCFHDGPAADQARRILEQLIFSTEDVNKICSTPDATRLPAMQRKALAMARALLLQPGLYLMDRPEDAASEKLIAALCGRIAQEKRMGRSVIMVTDNRALLDACDKLLVLQSGRIIDFGDAAEIRAKMVSGWSRFVAERALSSEDNLGLWLRGLFKRNGDETNRRNVSQIASELLAFSCQTRDPMAHQMLCFEFKHFEGHCLLRLLDDEPPLSSGQLKTAQDEAAAANDKVRLSPLAAVAKQAMTIEGTVENDRRVITAQIATYDPRKSAQAGANGHAATRA